MRSVVVANYIGEGARARQWDSQAGCTRASAGGDDHFTYCGHTIQNQLPGRDECPIPPSRAWARYDESFNLPLKIVHVAIAHSRRAGLECMVVAIVFESVVATLHAACPAPVAALAALVFPDEEQDDETVALALLWWVTVSGTGGRRV